MLDTYNSKRLSFLGKYMRLIDFSFFNPIKEWAEDLNTLLQRATDGQQYKKHRNIVRNANQNYNAVPPHLVRMAIY